jgi:hypothetical protein
MKDVKLFLMFIIGFVLGICIGSLFTDLLQPYLPAVLKPVREEIEGAVTAKELQKEKLLFTVSTPQGAILVTFDEKLSEIALLIAEGDTITLGVHQYEPFVSNPVIIRVRKEAPQRSKSLQRAIPKHSLSPLEPKTRTEPDEPEEDVAEDSISF